MMGGRQSAASVEQPISQCVSRELVFEQRPEGSTESPPVGSLQGTGSSRCKESEIRLAFMCNRNKIFQDSCSVLSGRRWMREKEKKETGKGRELSILALKRHLYRIE